MGQINKGKIASISGNTARVVPSDSGTKPTVMITIPANLRGILKKGTEVVYVEFADFTGMLLGRTDGVGGSGGGASITLDTTMTQEGQAAEAKAAGDRFQTIEKQIADLLYNAITITDFTNNVKTARIGQTVTAVTFSWAFSKDPVTVKLCDANGNTIEEPDVDSEGTTLPVSVKANTSWVLTATDERGAVATDSTGITFLHGVYYGVGATRTAYDSDFINALAVDWRTNKRPSVTLSPSNEHIYYCLPTWMGACSFSVGVLPGGFELADTIAHTNAYGNTQTYYVYRSVEALAGTGITVNIS